MAQALYRKYRSKSLEEVVGQDHITKTLALALKNKKINHAYLFTGPRGVGKTSIARILAHEVNGLPYSEDSRHLDIIEIDAASNRRIDDIRDLREKVHIAPTSAPYKVYIIDEVHMLTGESFNALLKTLEEPPKHAIFILATTEVQKLPATIISRAQRFHFRPISREAAVAHLGYIAKTEGIRIDKPALEMIAERGDGSFRDSISLLDQLASMTDQAIDAAFVEQILGIAPNAAITSLLTAIEAGAIEVIHEELRKLEDQGVSASTLSDQLINRIMKDPTLSAQYANLVDSLLDVAKSMNPKVKLLVTLLKYMAPSSQSHYTDKPKKPAVVAAVPAQELKKAEPKDIQQNVAPPAPAPAKPQPNKAVPATEAQEVPSTNPTGAHFNIDDWPRVLGVMQKSNPPLFSVLKRARVECDSDVLRLTFGFKLHQKKMDDQKYRSKLISVITSLGFKCPQIDTLFGDVGDVTFVPEGIAEEPVDETSASVLAMMGGGETVHAEN